MGIIQYIQKDRIRNLAHPIEKIRLKKPVVNIFLGDFQTEEVRVLPELMDKRVGTVDKIQYAQIVCKGAASHIKEEHFTTVRISDLPYENKLGLQEREAFKKDIEKSHSLGVELKKYVNKVYNSVTQYSYQEAGRIRINVILKVDDLMAACVDRLVTECKDRFGESFPEYVYIDIYCILDEYLYDQNSAERNAYSYLAIEEVSRLSKAPDLVFNTYCLSNRSSEGVLTPDCIDKLMTVIGLSMIIKDGESAADKYNSFNEDRLRMKSMEDKKSIFSMGYLQFEKPDHVIKLILLKQILIEMQGKLRLVDDDIFTRLNITEDYLKVLCRKAGFKEITGSDTEILYPIVKDTDMKVYDLVGMTNRDALERLFGRNLDAFYEINLKNDGRVTTVLEQSITELRGILNDLCKDGGYSINEIFNLLSDKSKVVEKLNKLFELYSDAIAGVNNDLKRWQSGDVLTRNLKETVKGTDEPRIYYGLAATYLNLLSKIASVDFKRQVLSCYQEEVSQIRGKYESSLQLIQAAIDELEANIQLQLTQELELQVGNCNQYYSRLFTEIIHKKYSTGFQKFKAEVNQNANNGTLDENTLYQLLVEFASTLEDEPCFGEDFTIEMVKRLSDYKSGSRILGSKADIYNLAYATIRDKQEFYLKIVQNSQFNKQICFFAHESDEFIEHIIDRMNQDNMQNISIFYERDFNSIDMLYIVGCFSKEQIDVFQSNWKKSYEVLCQDGSGAVEHE